jgi:predicted esterase YcpF (UPF0227 family)
MIEINGINKDILIITFAGLALSAFGTQPFEFMNSLQKWFPDISKKFYIDLNKCWYHKGIRGISTNIDDTKIYLENIIKDYKKVIFVGSSAGGYAAILFGSLLNISYVIAFMPQTFLIRKDMNDKYRNLRFLLNQDTQYYLYGDISIKDVNDLHHIAQCKNLENYKNCKIIYKNEINLRQMRDNGELKEIFESVIMDKKEI